MKKLWQTKRSEAQRTLRFLENEWWLKIAADLQRAADSGDLQSFYSSLKQVFGLTNRSLIPVRSQDGNVLLTGRQQILDRWHDHYRDLLNTHVPCDPAQLDVIPDRPIIRDLDATPSREEVVDVIRNLKSGKSPGVDGIPG